MKGSDLEKYCEKAIQGGATRAKEIHPMSVVTAPWVIMKCLFGCQYRAGFCCPPHSPTHDQTRKVLDSYQRAILFHREAPRTKERGEQNMKFFDMLLTMEGDLFKDGYYKAFAILAGPCALCKECGKVDGLEGDRVKCPYGGSPRCGSPQALPSASLGNRPPMTLLVDTLSHIGRYEAMTSSSPQKK